MLPHGLFNVNMPLIYGEKERAFKRLQQELIKETDDHSNFASSMNNEKVSGLLAPAPSHFAECGTIVALGRLERLEGAVRLCTYSSVQSRPTAYMPSNDPLESLRCLGVVRIRDPHGSCSCYLLSSLLSVLLDPFRMWILATRE